MNKKIFLVCDYVGMIFMEDCIILEYIYIYMLLLII